MAERRRAGYCRLVFTTDAYYTTPKLNVRFLMFSWERGPLARLRAGRPRSQLRPYCRVLSY